MFQPDRSVGLKACFSCEAEQCSNDVDSRPTEDVVNCTHLAGRPIAGPGYTVRAEETEQWSDPGASTSMETNPAAA